jgi:N6-L-threonylcarbamoyladenine synthase
MPRAVEAPFLGLVVSGGHTTLYEVPTLGTYRRLGTTRDDAAGEAYDKVAKLLGLPYPGGLPIDQMARKGRRDAIRFPRALPAKDILDWSFSGLKTAVSLHVKEHGVPTEAALFDLCASFQEAVADALTRKLQLAIEKTAAQRVVLAGGVAANSRLRELSAERVSARGAELFLPSIELCTDNGAMIAVAGHEAMKRGQVSDFGLDAQPNWRL